MKGRQRRRAGHAGAGDADTEGVAEEVTSRDGAGVTDNHDGRGEVKVKDPTSRATQGVSETMGASAGRAACRPGVRMAMMQDASEDCVKASRFLQCLSECLRERARLSTCHTLEEPEGDKRA